MNRTASPSMHLPPIPTRSYSASTSSTAYTTSTHSSGNRYFANANMNASPKSDYTPLSTPASIGMGIRNTSEEGERSWDEVDRLGYMYSLRVATLHQHLLHPPATTPTQNFATPPMPPLPSPQLQGTSSSGSRLNFGFPGSRKSSMHAPESEFEPVQSPPVPRRKSTFSLAPRKKDIELKLPKEFLAEFWGVLGDEQGGAGWSETVAIFLGDVKKGTKTSTGLNLREIPVLLESFTQAIPPPSPAVAPAHLHQSHFLHLLHSFLPRSTHFSPISRAQSEKDRDLLFRLRVEVQSYMLETSPDPGNDPSSLAAAGFSSGSRSPSSPAPTLGRTSSAQSDSLTRRKPSPRWTGDDDMVETVALVWGRGMDIVEKDLYSVKRSGSLDQLYLTDLKGALSLISTLPPPLNASQKARQQVLSQSLTSLLAAFPTLAIPGSPTTFTSETDTFFSPPRRGEVFARLVARAGEAGHNGRTRDLVERCREIWGIASRRDKEKEIENIMPRWRESIGTQEEAHWGKILGEAVKDLSHGISPDEQLPPVMSDLLNNLLSLVTSSVTAIFPSNSVPPRPSPSLLPLLNAAPQHFCSKVNGQQRLNDIVDELKGAAVGEYVQAVGNYTDGMGGGESSSLVEGYEAVAKWIEKEVNDVRRVWGRGVVGYFDPASVILSRQLPLFFAEIQVLDQPSKSRKSDVFGLYEVTGRLVDTWEELCPRQEHGFELDAFFEPHVLAWLKDTEANTTQEWVSRAVGMDSWVPEGHNRHSQSVIDLFEFIRGSVKVVLQDLPLSEYKRAVYLIDLSKTISVAVNQYSSTVHALFVADLNPAKPSTPEIQNKLSGKAGSWLAKGQQAVKSLEKKKLEGFILPPIACVKLTDMGAAQECVSDLVFALEAEDTKRIVKQHRLPDTAPDRNRHVFSVTVMRGEGLLGKGTRAADGFAVVTDKETGERLIKTETVLGVEDPNWEQTFEVSVGRVKTLEVGVFDRSLVGKHDPIGSSTFKLDPRSFASGTRDVMVPLSPRGAVHLRVTMEGGEKHDVEHHLSTAVRALERTANDMVREIVDKMLEFVKTVLSPQALMGLTKILKDKKKPRSALSPAELEISLGPLFEYLNQNFSVFSVTLTEPTRLAVMFALWKRIVNTLISLLVPPLSDRPSTKEALGSQEIDVVFKWLQMLKGFFNASEGGAEYGVPMGQLQSGNYKDLIMLGQYLDLPGPALRERCTAAVKSAGVKSAGGMAGMSLGNEEDNDRMAEVLLRIARTRPDMGEFLTQQIGQLTRARIERQASVL